MSRRHQHIEQPIMARGRIEVFVKVINSDAIQTYNNAHNPMFYPEGMLVHVEGYERMIPWHRIVEINSTVMNEYSLRRQNI